MQVKLHLRKMTFYPQYRMQERMELEEKLMARLREISDQRQIAAFAQKCGVSQANLSRAVGVKAQQLGLDKVSKILSAMGALVIFPDEERYPVMRRMACHSPTENVKEESVLNAHARVERPAENPEPEAVLSRQPSLAFDEFFEAFPEQHRGGRSEAAGEWVALESNRALPGLPRILDALGQWEDSEAWKRQGGRYIPTAANFLKREYWLRKPPEPAEQGGNGEQARPRVATVAQQRVQDNDDMAKMLLQARRAQHAQPGLHASTAGQSGAALPASR
jgi:predicted XRE-type DNA-binding protein